MADLIVVGAGLIGSAIAWRLAEDGRRVTLVDRGEPGAEASSAAGGALIPEAGLGPHPSRDLLRLYLTSLARYPSFVDEVRAATGAAFEYQAPGRLFLALSDDEVEPLKNRVPIENAAGSRAEWLDAATVRDLEPNVTPAQRGALFFPDNGWVDNGRLSTAVAQAAARAGVTVRTHEAVLALGVEGGKVVGVQTTREKIAADRVVLAAGCWSSQLAPWRAGTLVPAKGEMIALHALPRPVQRMIGTVGCTVVPRADGRMMVGATRTDRDSSKHVRAEAVARMIALGTLLIPSLAQARFADAWAGSRPLTPDGEPVIGPDGEVDGLYWATGHLGMGILSAPTTADVFADLFAGRPPRVPIAAFSPQRFAAAVV